MELGSLTSFFTSMPTDWIIIGFFALIMFVDALRVGSGRISTIAFSALITQLAVATIPTAAFMGFASANFSTPVLQAALFGIMFVVVFLLIRRVFIDYGEENGMPIQAIFASVAVTAIVMVVWVQVPALDAVWHFSDPVRHIFGETYRFWWLLVSLAALAFAKA